MPPEHRPFTSTGTWTTHPDRWIAAIAESSEDAGLGLTISRQLARGMGGDVISASELGNGSTFTVVLTMAGSGEQP